MPAVNKATPNKEIECAWKDCHNKFIKRKADHIYCSKECSQLDAAYKKRKATEKRNKNRKREVCAYPGCKNKFLPKSEENIFCSNACAEKNRNESLREQRRATKKEEECAFDGCSNVFTPKNKTNIYCSHACAVAADKQKRRSNKDTGKHFLEDPEISTEDLIAKEKEKEKILRERKHLLNEIKQQGKFEYLVDQLKSALVVQEPLPIQPIRQSPSIQKLEEAILFISDCHIGEEVLLDETGGLGEFNLEIFKAELDNVAESIHDIMEIQRSKLRIDTLNIVFLGDTVNHELIYEGQQAYNEFDLYEQVFQGQYLLSNFIGSLAPHFKWIKVKGVVGNHGRVGKKGQTKKHVNFDYMIYNNLPHILSKHDNISFNFPKSFWMMDNVMGHGFFYEHGENIKQYLRTPYYSLETTAKDYFALVSAIEKKFEYFCCAHFHQMGRIQTSFGELILNGTFVGPNQFSIEVLKSGMKPRQYFFGVNERYGITYDYWMHLGR